MILDSKPHFISYMVSPFQDALIQSRFEPTNPVHPLDFLFLGNKDLLQLGVTEMMFLGDVGVSGSF